MTWKFHQRNKRLFFHFLLVGNLRLTHLNVSLTNGYIAEIYPLLDVEYHIIFVYKGTIFKRESLVHELIGKSHLQLDF